MVLPPPPCPTNGRWVTARDCVSGTNVNWGCITVNNGQVPQINQVVTAGATLVGNPSIIVHYKINNVQPQNTNIPGTTDLDLTTYTGCGWDCSKTTPYSCEFTGIGGGVSQFGSYTGCLNGLLNNECDPPPWLCQDFNCFEILYPNGVVWSGPLTNITSQDALGHIVGAASSSCFDPGQPWGNVGVSLNPGPITPTQPQGSNPNYVSNIPPGQHATIFRDIYNAGPCHGYSPLSNSYGDCLSCCGGVNNQLTALGQINPFWAWGNANQGASSMALITYAATLGVDSCGQV